MENLITQKDILNNYRKYAFKCSENNIDDVRGYLEKQLGFRHGKWSTSDFTDLNYLYIASNREVHGAITSHSSLLAVSIDHLVYPDKFSNQDVYHTNLDTSEFKKIELI